MNPGITFAIIAAVAFGAWTVFHQQASDKINYLFGAIIVSLTAVLSVGSVSPDLNQIFLKMYL